MPLQSPQTPFPTNWPPGWYKQAGSLRAAGGACGPSALRRLARSFCSISSRWSFAFMRVAPPALVGLASSHGHGCLLTFHTFPSSNNDFELACLQDYTRHLQHGSYGQRLIGRGRTNSQNRADCGYPNLSTWLHNGLPSQVKYHLRTPKMQLAIAFGGGRL